MKYPVKNHHWIPRNHEHPIKIPLISIGIPLKILWKSTNFKSGASALLGRPSAPANHHVVLAGGLPLGERWRTGRDSLIWPWKKGGSTCFNNKTSVWNCGKSDLPPKWFYNVLSSYFRLILDYGVASIAWWFRRCLMGKAAYLWLWSHLTFIPFRWIGTAK